MTITMPFVGPTNSCRYHQIGIYYETEVNLCMSWHKLTQMVSVSEKSTVVNLLRTISCSHSR